MQFLEAQVYRIDDNNIFKDKQSTMIMENNGKYSYRKKSRHTDIHYFLITKIMYNKEVTIE